MPLADAEFKVTKARSDLVRSQPFFGTLALRLQMKKTNDPRIPVMGTDGRYLYYNPEGVGEISQPEVLGVVAHEVMHCALQHLFRRGHRDHKKWNRACDYVVNKILLDSRFSLPASRLFNGKYEDMPAEQVYELLLAESSDDDKDDSWDFGSALAPDTPDPETGEKPSQNEIQSASKDWEIATKQAAEIAKQKGNLPGHLESLIDELLQPQVPWREQLWHFLNQRKPDRVSWNRPNRRLISYGLYIPSKKHVPTGDIVVAVDTSGSISEDELQIFASEISDIHKTIQPQKLYILDIDTQIHDIRQYGPYDEPEMKYRGRGGTEFEPVFRWIDEENIQPDALVYLTDGYAHFPEEEPMFPVLWCITNTEVEPPWGQHLVLDVQY